MEKISALLYRVDPMGLKSPHEGEYDSEARIISDLLGECSTPQELHLVIYETFCEQFSPELVGKPERLGSLTAIVWSFRRHTKSLTPTS